MFRTDIASTLGIGFETVKYTLTSTDLTAAATTQTIAIPDQPGGNNFLPAATVAPPNGTNFTIPQGGVLLYVKVHHTQAFAGGTIASMTVSVGKVGGSNTFCTSPFNIFQAAADGTLQETFNIPSGQLSTWGVTVTFTSTGGNLNTATAGSVDIYLTYLNVSTPNA